MTRIISVVALFALLFAIATAAEDYKSGEFVSSLDDAGFDAFLKENEFVLVEFFAPWCPHCKSLAEPYAEAAKILKDEGSAIKLADVNCEKANEICTRFQIPGFPTLKLFKNGQPFKDYDDGRKAADIVSFLKRKTGPLATALKADEVAAFVKKSTEKSVVVGYFASKESPLVAPFLASAGALDDFVFAEVTEAGQTDKIVLHRYFDEAPVEVTGKTEAAISSFVKENGYPLVDEINGQTFRRFVDSGLPIAVLFVKNDDNKKKYIDVVTEAAVALKGKVAFGYSDGDEYGGQLEMMGGDPSKLPAVAAMDIQKRNNFPYAGELTVEALKKWASGIADGSIEPFLKSQPIPETNDEPVKVVVGKSFKDIVLDESKDVLIEFYAPWCGHCKKLVPIYDELAESFKDVDSLVIAKLDATENDVSDVAVEGFPTIFFFPSNDKKNPITYEGERSVEGFKRFLKERAVASKDKILAAEKPEEKADVKEEL